MRAGASSTYNIRVGRSTSMTGGFVDKDGVALTSGGGTKIRGDGNGWVGPGGQMVVVNGTRAYLVVRVAQPIDGSPIGSLERSIWLADPILRRRASRSGMS